MSRQSGGGRGLWPAVLMMTVAFVAADFLRQPLDGPDPGVAAAPGPALVVWVPSVAAETPGEQLAQAAARRLDRPWRPVAARRVHGGGSATAITTLLAHPSGSRPPLMLVDAGTVADLERDRRGGPLPAIAEEATRAERLLRESVPIAVLAEDPLVVAATANAAVQSPQQLIAAMRRAPEQTVFGLAQDAWSKTALAALVHSVGVSGDVRYRLLPTADAAVVERAGDLADVVVAPRSELHALPLAGRLRLLAAGGDGAGATRLADLLPPGAPVARAQRWVALVAPRGTAPRVRDALRRQLRRMTASSGWRETLRRLSFAPPPAQPPARYLAEARRRQTALQTAAAHVAQRTGRRR